LISIGYQDLLPISDQLSNLSGRAIDLILETPGGSGESAEDIVRLLHGKYEEVGIIVPGCAKSAGTIMAMAADEILMEPVSSLGPIDAQIQWQGKVFSADALIEGMEKIKKEVTQTGSLNKAYIPILQGISPGELQNAENALAFAKDLVTDWLAHYKFKTWTTHASTGAPVSESEKKARAKEVAEALCHHRRWKTHGRSIKLEDLEKMRLKITDYSKMPDLADAIRRYYTLLQMSFASNYTRVQGPVPVPQNLYKLFETPQSQIYRFMTPPGSPAPAPFPGMPGPVMPSPQQAEVAIIEATCGQCGTISRVQANLGKKRPLQAGCIPFPANNRLACPRCSAELDLSGPRKGIEAQLKKPVVV
jgi:ClpP class serine protease